MANVAEPRYLFRIALAFSCRLVRTIRTWTAGGEGTVVFMYLSAGLCGCMYVCLSVCLLEFASHVSVIISQGSLKSIVNRYEPVGSYRRVLALL